jgi:hypothetical protein
MTENKNKTPLNFNPSLAINYLTISGIVISIIGFVVTFFYCEIHKIPLPDNITEISLKIGSIFLFAILSFLLLSLLPAWILTPTGPHLKRYICTYKAESLTKREWYKPILFILHRLIVPSIPVLFIFIINLFTRNESVILILCYFLPFLSFLSCYIIFKEIKYKVKNKKGPFFELSFLLFIFNFLMLFTTIQMSQIIEPHLHSISIETLYILLTFLFLFTNTLALFSLRKNKPKVHFITIITIMVIAYLSISSISKFPFYRFVEIPFEILGYKAKLPVEIKIHLKFKNKDYIKKKFWSESPSLKYSFLSKPILIIYDNKKSKIFIKLEGEESPFLLDRRYIFSEGYSYNQMK